MADAMREAAEHAYTMTAHNYAEAPVGSRDWTLFWRGWQAALAEQPAQGEAVAWRAVKISSGVEFPWYPTPYPQADSAFFEQHKMRIEFAYAAPPAPAVPDDVAQDAARYRFIRSADCHVHCIYFTSFGERFNLAGEDLDHSIDAAMLAAAPEVPRG